MKHLLITIMAFLWTATTVCADDHAWRSWAPTPPMGWNSFDAWGSRVTEDQILENAEYMRDNLKDYGWETGSSHCQAEYT